jgi:hypothetical protein
MGSPHGLPPPAPVAEPEVPEPVPEVPEPVAEPEVPEPVPEVPEVDDEDVPVARSAALIEEALNATLAPTPSVMPKKSFGL